MTDQEVDETTIRLRRLARWLLIAMITAVSGFSLAVGASLAYFRSQALSVDRNAWDNATSEHNQCVTMARSRAVTIDTGHAQFDAQVRFVDLIDGILSLVRPSEVQTEAFAKTADERNRIAADRAAFDLSRPPLDEAKCPPPPVGRRP